MFDAKEFGMRLMEARTMRDMNQPQLAKAADLSIQAVSYLESGQRVPMVDNVVRLADALNVDIEWLCCVQDVPRRAEAMQC